MKKKWISLALGSCLCGMAIPAGATMIDLGNDLLYDDQQNITWYDYPFQVPCTIDSLLDDYRATLQWAADLEYVGLTDWRIPTLWEWHLSEEQFGDDYEDPARQASSLFSREYLCLTSTLTYYEVLDETGQLVSFDGPSVYRPLYGEVGPSLWDTVAVVTDGTWQGGSGAAPVPEPATMLLTGVGLAGAGLSRLRRKKKNG